LASGVTSLFEDGQFKEREIKMITLVLRTYLLVLEISMNNDTFFMNMNNSFYLLVLAISINNDVEYSCLCDCFDWYYFV
jgi:hypothetical protein